MPEELSALALLIHRSPSPLDAIAGRLVDQGWRVMHVSRAHEIREAIQSQAIGLALAQAIDRDATDPLRRAGIPTLVLGEDCDLGLPPAMEAIRHRVRAPPDAPLEHRYEALQREHTRLLDASLHTRHHLEAQLQEAQEALAEAGRSKSAFLANMSHELRTPLNAILGYAEILQEDVRDAGAPELANDLEKIHASGSALLSLINDILDLARIEAGRAEVYPQLIEVRELCEAVIEAVHERASARGNTLNLDIGPLVTTLFSDQRKTRQCLLNLLDNACKFTEEGQIHLRVRANPSPGSRRVFFEVEDDGVGLSPRQQVEIFREFVQTEDPSRRTTTGTGLGLSITQRLADLLGGRLSVESELGRGSVFRLEVPDQHDVEVTEEPDWVTDHGAGQGAPPTVLIVDPDESTRAHLTRILTAEGYQLLEARSGAEGVAFAERFGPDVICLDAGTQEVDGWPTLKAIKSRATTAHIPVVMITRLDDRSRGIVLGASEYLVKPIARDALLRAIRQVQADPESEPILLVEDDAPTREMTARMLRSEGYQVLEAENGRVALERIARVRPSLILLDLMMPELDGFSVVEAVRGDPASRDIPIVIVTAMELPPSQRGLLEQQVETIVGKAGYDRDALVEEVRRIVGARVPPNRTPHSP